MDSISEPNPKSSYEELLEQNSQLKKQIKSVQIISKPMKLGFKFVLPLFIFFAQYITSFGADYSNLVSPEFSEYNENESLSDTTLQLRNEEPQRSRIIVGGDFNFPPYEFLDENGQPTGFNVELTYAIAEEMGINVVVELRPWAQTLHALLNKEIDIVQGMFYSIERDKIFDLSQPHSLISHVFVCRKGVPMPNNLEELRGKKVVVMQDDIMHDLLIQKGFDEQIILAETQQQALEWINEGKYEYALPAEIPALYWIEKNRWENLEVDYDPIINPEYCYASLEKSNIVQLFSEGLVILKEKGKYREIYDKWLHVYEDHSLTVTEKFKYSSYVVIPLLLILFFSIFWSRTLKKKVRTKTKELVNEIEIRKKSEQKFRILADSTNDWEYWLDENNKYVFISPACKKITGYSEKEFYENSDFFMDLVCDDYRDEAYNHYHDSNRIKSKHTSEFPIINKNNKEIWIEHSCIPIFDEEGKFLGRRGNNRDITDRKIAKRELISAKLKAETNEAKFRNMYEHSTIGIAIVGLDFKIINANKTYCQILGYKEDELIGKELRDITHTETIEKNLELQRELARGEIPYFQMEKKFIHKSGNTIHGILNATLINDNNGQPLYFVGNVLDITTIKEYEFNLKRAKEKAEESDRLKSAFLANMSHEIRTPMNGILGFTSLLQEANLSLENQKEFIDIIKKSGDRLLNTVNDIIEISRIESGEIKITKSEVDLIMHLDTLVTFFKPEAENKGLEIIVQNNIDENDLTITTDKNKLDSILSNLIKNAIKYTDVGTIKVGLKVENNQIIFSCQDTGIGIPESRQEAIFNRFEQADIEDKHAHQGSGLGLAIVKTYVEMLDGKIWLESEEGKGSTFYVSFSFENENKKEQIIPQEVKSNDSGIKNINVLVVEDDEISSMHLSAILKGKAKNIITRRNGIEAIDACKKDSGIDLILMDMKMPVMGGIEATKKIREFNKDIVIIAQTAYALEGDREKALAAGCNDYISKPIKKDKLFELINKYF